MYMGHMMVMRVETHLSFREISGILIQLINMGSESLEIGNDELLAESLSEQDNVVLNTPNEQTTNSMLKYWNYTQLKGKFVNHVCNHDV